MTCPFIRLQTICWLGRVLSRTIAASQLISRCEAVRTVPNFAQLIMLAYGTCASESAKICRHSVGVWRFASAKFNASSLHSKVER